MDTAGFVMVLALAGAVLGAQPPPAQQGVPVAPPAAAAAAPAPIPPKALPTENYTYEPAGRRDPFITLLGAGSDPKQTSRKGDGPAGMTVAEVSVRGVLQSRDGLIAMVQGPDSKTYIVHPGDKLLDGAIKSITPQGLVIEQEVKDPLSVVKQREVRKLLRGLEDAK